MLTRILVATLVLLAIGTTKAVAADDTLPQIQLSLRLCKGSARHPEKLAILSAPTVLTTSGRQATIMSGAEHIGETEDIRVQSGVACELTPTLRKDGRILVEFDFSNTQPVKDESGVVSAAQGICIRGAVLATPGKKLTIGDSKQKDDVWLELTAEIVERVK